MQYAIIIMTSVSPVHVGRALESLRNSNYDTVSAMGEVIDNALEANAKNIRIRIKAQEKDRKRRDDYTEIAFGDDGVGMPKDILHQCLQLGFSERYNDRKGIGRFGVGMTLGAITQATRIEVYSKTQGGEWNFTYIDLNEIKDDDNPLLPEPVHSTIPTEYASLIADHGTLVIWKNWDREDAKYLEMEHWIGRTYRKFIGEEIIENDEVVPNNDQRHIFISKGTEEPKEITAYDPLYVTKTKYDQEKSYLIPSIDIMEEIHNFDPPTDKKFGSSSIIIRLSLLPKNWRTKPRLGGTGDNVKRRVHTNEGFSILRNNREVFYGHIPHIELHDEKTGARTVDIDRYWGCEISFNADLDHWFSVKNIKVGAKPLPELRKKIEDAITPTINTFRKEIRDYWTENIANEKTENEGALSGTGDAEDIISRNNPKPKQQDEDEINQLLKDSGEERAEIIKKLTIKINKQPVTFVKSDKIDKQGNFIDVKSYGGISLITLNMKNAFFEKFFDILEEIKNKSYSESDRELLSQKTETIFNLLIGSFALAQRQFIIGESQTSEDFVDKLLRNWTFELSKTANDMINQD